MAKNTYLDPRFDQIEAKAASSVGVDPALLRAIRTHGERTNPDQVAAGTGARTVWQITQSTRDAFLKKHGIDAFASEPAAAKVAAMVLKDGLRWGGGDPVEAAAYYHAGGDKKAHGKITQAYKSRVAEALGVGQQDALAGLTQDQLDQVYTAYRTGKMTPEHKAQYEAAVSDGRVKMPMGGRLIGQFDAAQEPEPAQANVIPTEVLDAYRSGRMTPEHRQQLESAVSAGQWVLPEGQEGLQGGAMNRIGSASRDVLRQGVRGTAADVVLAPIELAAKGGAGLLREIGAGVVGAAATAGSAAQDLLTMAGLDVGTSNPLEVGKTAIAAMRDIGVDESGRDVLEIQSPLGRVVTEGIGAAVQKAQSAAGERAQIRAEELGLSPEQAAANAAAAEGIVGAALNILPSVKGRQIAQVARGGYDVLRGQPAPAAPAATTTAAQLMTETPARRAAPMEVAAPESVAPRQTSAPLSLAPMEAAAESNVIQMPRRRIGPAVVKTPVERVVSASDKLGAGGRHQTGGYSDNVIMQREAVLREMGFTPEEMRAGALTGDEGMAAAETRLSKLEGDDSAVAMKRQFENESTKQAEYALDTIRQTGGEPMTPPELRGATIYEPLKLFRESLQAQKRAIYDAAKDVAGKAGGVELKTVSDLFGKDDLWLRTSESGNMRKSLQAWLRQAGITDKKGKQLRPITAAEAEMFRQNVNSFWDVDRKKLGPAVSELANAIDLDVARTAGGGFYDNARALHRYEMQLFEKESSLGKIMDVDGPTNRAVSLEKIPDLIVQKITSDAAQYRRIKRAFDEMPAEMRPLVDKAMGEIKAAMAEKVLAPSIELVGDSVQWKGFGQTQRMILNQLGPKIAEVLGQDVAARIKLQDTASRILQRVDKNQSGSGTEWFNAQTMVGKLAQGAEKKIGVVPMAGVVANVAESMRKSAAMRAQLRKSLEHGGAAEIVKQRKKRSAY